MFSWFRDVKSISWGLKVESQLHLKFQSSSEAHISIWRHMDVSFIQPVSRPIIQNSGKWFLIKRIEELRNGCCLSTTFLSSGSIVEIWVQHSRALPKRSLVLMRWTNMPCWHPDIIGETCMYLVKYVRWFHATQVVLERWVTTQTRSKFFTFLMPLMYTFQNKFTSHVFLDFGKFNPRNFAIYIAQNPEFSLETPSLSKPSHARSIFLIFHTPDTHKNLGCILMSWSWSSNLNPFEGKDF